MALQFIFGGSGSGKSHHLYQTIIRESGEHPDFNYLVLVPEQFTMQTQKDLVLMHEKKGIMNIDVLSFGRLAHRVFEETGRGGAPILDDEGKSLILRKIAKNFEAELKVLKGNMKKPGYISELKSVISEFTQYDVGPEAIETVMEQAGEESYLYYKLRDVKLLYAGFQEYLKDKFITKEEVLDVLCGAACESELLKNSTVALDGFTGFTPVQERLLGKLMEICKDVVITVTIDSGEDPYTYAHPYQLFGMSKHTVASLMKIARQDKITVREPVCLGGRPFFRFRDSNPLGYLEESLFRYKTKPFREEQDAVEIHEAANPREEAALAAAKVRRLVRTEGLRYREIGVIAADMDAYGDYLEQEFSKFGIPVFMDHKRSILLNSFVEYIRSLLAMVEENFTYDSVFRFLRSGYSIFSGEELDGLDNYVAGMGVKGYRRWQERWIRKLKGMEESELEKMNHLRVRFVEEVKDLIFVLTQRKKTVRDVTEALYGFLVKEGMQEKLLRQEKLFQEMGELALSKEYGQIYRIVIELFDKFVALLGDETVSLREYGELLEAGLNEARIGVIPPGLDQVVVGDVERTRLKDVKVLLFLGANDTFLPGALRQTGILSERDREKFAKEKFPLAPGSKEKIYIQKFYLYLNLTKPSRKLQVFYSRVSSEGKSIRPSYLIQELKRLYPAISVTEEDKKALRDKEMTENTAVWDLIEGIRMQDESVGSAWMELYSWYKGTPRWEGRLRTILDAGFYRRPAGGISEAAAKRLYGEDFVDSITRMELFSSCEFSHFLTYGLRLKKRQEYEFQAFDMGNVLHGALERYSWKVERTGKGWTGIEESKRRQYARESIEEAVTDYGNFVLYSSSRNEYMITRMTRIMERTVWALTRQLEKGDFTPEGYEIRFENGKIDRMDTCVDEDTVYVKVVDYKTGPASFDVSALYYGLKLQLMVYMNAALDLAKRRHPGKEAVPAGAFYYQVRDPYIGRVEDEKLRDEKILKELRPDGLVSLWGEALHHLEHSAEGESLAVPVKFNKNGSLSKTSKAVDGEAFQMMADFARMKVAALHKKILKGDTGVFPYRFGDKTGCDFCIYRNICGFDPKLFGCGYREIYKLPQEEAVAKMKRELEESKGEGGEPQS